VAPRPPARRHSPSEAPGLRSRTRRHCRCANTEPFAVQLSNASKCCECRLHRQSRAARL